MIPPKKSRAGESPTHHSRYGDGAPGVISGSLVFDAGKLHSQLANLLQIYLKRAGDPDAVKQCSAKDAVACAKNITQMMTDLQAGKLSGNARRVVASKPASVDKNTEWPRMESRAEQIPNRVRGAHQRRSYGGDGAYVSKSRAGESPTHHSRYGDGAPGVLNMDGTSSSPADSRKLTADSCKPGVLNGNSSPAASCLLHPTGSVPILEAALSAVLATDEESHLPEPYQRLLSRMDRLCAEIRARLEGEKERVRRGGADHKMCPLDSLPAAMEGRRHPDSSPATSCFLHPAGRRSSPATGYGLPAASPAAPT